MNPRSHERRSHFRGKPRPGRVMSVRYRAGASEAWQNAETRDIGRQEEQLRRKFLSLAGPVIGADAAGTLAEDVLTSGAERPVRALLRPVRRVAPLARFARTLGIDPTHEHLTAALLVVPMALLVSTGFFWWGSRTRNVR